MYRAQHPEVRFERQPIPVVSSQADLEKQGENARLVEAFGSFDALQEVADVALVPEQGIVEQIVQLQGRQDFGGRHAEDVTAPAVRWPEKEICFWPDNP